MSTSTATNTPAVVHSGSPTPARPDGASNLPLGWLAGLNRLEEACVRHEQVDQNLRGAVVQVAQQIAERLGGAGLVETPLPRGYEVRVFDREYFLVKCEPDTREVRFVASGQESLLTLLSWHVSRLTGEFVVELSEDLENGLLEEIAAFIEGRVSKVHASLPSMPASTQRMRLVDLGRKTKSRKG